MSEPTIAEIRTVLHAAIKARHERDKAYLVAWHNARSGREKYSDAVHDARLATLELDLTAKLAEAEAEIIRWRMARNIPLGQPDS